MYDVIIAGGGPAGMTAALYAVRNGKTALVIEKAGFGGQITHSPKVENYPGTLSMSGNEFADRMLDQILAQGAEIEFETVVSVKPAAEDASVMESASENVHETDSVSENAHETDSVSENAHETESVSESDPVVKPAAEDAPAGFVVRTEEGSAFPGRTVVLATGVKHRMLGLPGEEDLVGEGISFCAVCDGDFYSGKTVCVAGGGNSALQEAILLAGKCKEVIMLQDLPGFTGEKKLQEVLFKNSNVKAYTSVSIRGFLKEGEELCGVRILDKTSGQEREIACDGLFVAIGLIPENEPFAEIADLNEYGYFDTDEQCITRTPGLFVAGDCRRKHVRQLTTAVADGATAALAACRYIDGM